MSTSFTGTGNGPHVIAGSGDTLTYELSGTWVATMVLEKSTSGGLAWSTVATKTSNTDIDFLVETSDLGDAWYRWRCSAFTSGTVVSDLTVTAASTGGSGSGSLGSDVDLASAEVTGVLPVANGGTASSTALNNNRVMVSSTDAIVEATAITAARALISDANGIPTHSAVTSTVLGYLDVGSSLTTLLGDKAPLASPTFTGTVTLPNAVTVTSSAMTFGNTQRVTHGTVTVGNENNENARYSIRCPTGGRVEGMENSQQLFTILADSANWGAFALSRDWTMQWQMGKGTSHYGKGKVRGYSSITAASSATTELDLISKTVQANILANDGECLTITAFGTTGANANAKVVRLYVGGTAIGTISTSANAKVWKYFAQVFRTGASAEKYVVEMNIDGTITVVSGTLAVSTTATIVVKISGEEVITAEAMTIDYDRAGN